MEYDQNSFDKLLACVSKKIDEKKEDKKEVQNLVKIKDKLEKFKPNEEGFREFTINEKNKDIIKFIIKSHKEFNLYEGFNFEMKSFDDI